jgi:hypothetical protein
VAENGPVDAALLELRNRDLASVGAVGLVVDILGSDLETLAEVLAGGEQEERRGGNDNLCVAVRRLRWVKETTWLHIPTLESSLALLRLETISLVELRVPFLGQRQSSIFSSHPVPAYILKLPPIKNWRPILAVGV